MVLSLKRKWIAAALTIAASFCVVNVPAEEIVCDGSTTVGPIAKAFAEYFMRKYPEVNVTVSESGSGNGAKSLKNRTCDVADMSRSMKQTEIQAAIENGVVPVPHVVALDGLPILVHPSNPAQGLTLEQIKDIYQGKITNWSKLGGPNLEIVVVSRDTNSGTYETFEEIVMHNEKIFNGAEYVGSNGAVRSRVNSTPAAIGYAGLGFVDETVKALEINGIYPDEDTVIEGTYPIARPLFMYTDGYPEMGSALYRFITLYLTRDGQEIIEEIGFVPLTRY